MLHSLKLGNVQSMVRPQVPTEYIAKADAFYQIQLPSTVSTLIVTNYQFIQY